MEWTYTLLRCDLHVHNLIPSILAGGNRQGGGRGGGGVIHRSSTTTCSLSSKFACGPTCTIRVAKVLHMSRNEGNEKLVCDAYVTHAWKQLKDIVRSAILLKAIVKSSWKNMWHMNFVVKICVWNRIMLFLYYLITCSGPHFFMCHGSQV